MKKFLLVSILFTLAIIVSMPPMAEVNTKAGISLSSPILAEAPQEVTVLPDTRGVYFFAAADADTPQGSQADRDEKPRDESLEKGKTARPQEKSEWKINVWPVEPQDNVKSLHEMKEENKHK